MTDRPGEAAEIDMHHTTSREEVEVRAVNPLSPYIER
jgi:hypothetical protein